MKFKVSYLTSVFYNKPIHLSKKKGFNLLEISVALTISIFIGFALYNMFSALTSSQSFSISNQQFKIKAYQVLNNIEKELKNVLIGEYYMYNTGSSIIYNLSSPTEKKAYNLEFICLTPSSGTAYIKSPHSTDDLFYNGETGENALNDIQQIYFCKMENSNTTNFETTLDRSKGRVSYDGSKIYEKILYLNDNSQLKFMQDPEQYDEGTTNNIDGLANSTHIGTNRKYAILGDNIVYIKYLFWGNQSINWNNDGSGDGNPIDSWDSTIIETNTNGDTIHNINELPKAIKVIATFNYNKEMYSKKSTQINNNKNQNVTFEKVILFTL